MDTLLYVVNVGSALGDAAKTTTSPVIWISGFSASGKTTVGRKVESMLKAKGVATIMLDGDDLRSIFAQKWGYSRAERIDLARIYFRLCSYLANQGITVVISAVAMYDEIRDWLRAHVPASIEIYLDVPEEERRARDRATKGIYQKVGSQAELYDEPRDPGLALKNYGGLTPDEAAQRIVEYVIQEHRPQTPDQKRTDHWHDFYREETPPDTPSSFARIVAEAIHPPANLLDVGCGNGRDAFFFASRGLQVLALDTSSAAIEAAGKKSLPASISFFVGTIGQLPPDTSTPDVIYSRFSLHAMIPMEEDELLTESVRRLRPGGKLFIECRSINDALARQGEIISATERISGHYRRFIVPDELRAKLDAAGFQIDHFVESVGLAKLGDDDPMVIRVHASIPA